MSTQQQPGQTVPAVLIANVLVWRKGRNDVLLQGGKIAALDPPSVPADATRIDGSGKVLLPGLVEAHTHVDKTLLGMGWHPHTAGPRLIDKIENERRVRRESGIDPARQSERQVRLSA